VYRTEILESGLMVQIMVLDDLCVQEMQIQVFYG